MLDLTKVLRDFESPAYGALAHATGILMRLIDADAAIALTRDKPNHIETTYVGSRGISLTPEQHRQLRNWPASPQSKIWHPMNNPAHCHAQLLAPDQPKDSNLCREAAQAWAGANTQINTTCLSVSLSSKPDSRALFVRRHGQPPFVHADLGRITRFAPQAAHAIQQGHRRELRLTGRTPDASSPIATIMPLEDLLDRLSTTEHRVMQRLQLHETERQVAEALDRSPNTIHVHVKSIYRKLMVTSRSQLLTLLDQTVHPTPAKEDSPRPNAIPA